MSLDTDHIVDRRRMRRKLTFWRVVAFLIAIIAVVGIAAAVRGPGGTFVQPIAAQISRVTIQGIIRGDEDRTKALDNLADSRATRAVIIHIDSPGGTTAGSEELHDALRRVALKKPTVVVVDGMAASGGYIAAMAADHIIAHNTSLVGSIGVLFQFPNVTDLLDTIGVKVEEIKSSPLKAAPNGFEPTSPEAHAAIESLVRGFLWLVQGHGAGPPQARRRGARPRRGRPRLHRSPGDRAQARRRDRQRTGSDRLARQDQPDRSEDAGPRLAPAPRASTICRSCISARSPCSKASASARWRTAWNRSGCCRRSKSSTLTGCWRFGTLRRKISGGRTGSVASIIRILTAALPPRAGITR